MGVYFSPSDAVPVNTGLGGGGAGAIGSGAFRGFFEGRARPEAGWSQSEKDPCIAVITPGQDRVEYVISAPAEIRIEG